MDQWLTTPRLQQSYWDRHGCCGASYAVFRSRNPGPSKRRLNTFLLSVVFCQAGPAVPSLALRLFMLGHRKIPPHPRAFLSCVLGCHPHRFPFVVLFSHFPRSRQQLSALGIPLQFTSLWFRVCKETRDIRYQNDVNNCRYCFASSF